MQINGVGNSQIGNSYQNPNRMSNSTTSKKEEEDINKRLEALGVKVELSFRQPAHQEQEPVKETTETESASETFSILDWVKKIWDAGIAWLKSIWNDEAESAEMFDAEAELVAESPVEEDADYSAVYAKESGTQQDNGEVDAALATQSGQFDFRVADEEQSSDNTDRYRTAGVALHTSGMQDSYNRYGQPSKLGVEPSNNMTMRK